MFLKSTRNLTCFEFPVTLYVNPSKYIPAWNIYGSALGKFYRRLGNWATRKVLLNSLRSAFNQNAICFMAVAIWYENHKNKVIKWECTRDIYLTFRIEFEHSRRNWNSAISEEFPALYEPRSTYPPYSLNLVVGKYFPRKLSRICPHFIYYEHRYRIKKDVMAYLVANALLDYFWFIFSHLEKVVMFKTIF